MTTLTSPAARAAGENTGAALMTAGGVLLGTLGVFLVQAGQHPLTAVWFRCVFGLLALSAWMFATGRGRDLRLAPRALFAALAAGLLMLGNWALFFAAIERSSIAVATVVFHVQPFWVMLLGAVFLGEPVGRRQWAAAALALVGLAFASGLASDAGPALGGRFLAGVLMCLGGSFSYALVTLIARGARGPGPLALAWWQCAVGALALAWWPALHGLPAWGVAWGWLAGLGVVHTGLAYVVLYAGMARLSAQRIALLQFVYPASAVLVDALAYGRWLDGPQAGGVLLMGLALAAAGRADPPVAARISLRGRAPAPGGPR